jgi:aryl-alcohol dehydrogenase-like predicted oxidoreductase
MSRRGCSDARWRRGGSRASRWHWTLRNPAVDGAIVGFRRPDQVGPIVDAANLELGEDDIAMIEGRA